MNLFARGLYRRGSEAAPWSDATPVREELFSVERLERHGESLASAQRVTSRPPVVLSLHTRLKHNAALLLAAYRASAVELESGRSISPAAEWLLDNYHVVEEQVREIRDDLPPGYYRQLPKLADGPLAGYPRVFGLAWAFVAHTDSHFDSDTLRRFIAAYQRVQPLTIGELWAVAITLRIVLVENLRRLAEQITSGRAARADANAIADRLLATGHARDALTIDIETRSPAPLSEIFAAQLAKRLRDQDPTAMPALGWLEQRLQAQGASVESVVQHAQQRQGASNVSVRNIITSMRLMSEIDWTALFESVSLVDARLREASAFAAMDFPTRDLYRSAIEQLSRGSSCSELEIVDRVLTTCRLTASEATDPPEADRVRDPGYHLIAGGRPAFERTIAFRTPAKLWVSRYSVRLGIGGYIGAILLVAAILLALSLWALATPGLGLGWLALFGVVGFLPATDVATALVNRVITWSYGAVTLPGLELKAGVPQSLRTLVAVPTLLTSESDLLEQIERLEVHHLASAGGDLTFALLADGIDADEEVLEGDAHLLAVGRSGDRSTERPPRAGPGRQPLPSAASAPCLQCERRTNGWAGSASAASCTNSTGSCAAPPTRRSPPPSATCRRCRRACATSSPSMPIRDCRETPRSSLSARWPIRSIDRNSTAIKQRVIEGYGILQPRVTPSLPIGREGSFYQRIFSGPGGIDPYAAAVSDVYQDLFGEGSYTGKGIYDVDAFEAALAGRVPENTLLSHDLFEGIFARAGLASDVEVVEEFPSRYDVAARRQHRWTRGDWQLLPWVFAWPKRHEASAARRAREDAGQSAAIAARASCLDRPWPWLVVAHAVRHQGHSARPRRDCHPRISSDRFLPGAASRRHPAATVTSHTLGDDLQARGNADSSLRRLPRRSGLANGRRHLPERWFVCS